MLLQLVAIRQQGKGVKPALRWAGFGAGKTRRPLIHNRADTGFSGKSLLASNILAFIGDLCLEAAFETIKDT